MLSPYSAIYGIQYHMMDHNSNLQHVSSVIPFLSLQSEGEGE